MSQPAPPPAPAKNPLSNTDIARLIGVVANRLDEQTATFASLAGIVATMRETTGCDPRLAMAGAAMMIPRTPQNEALRKAAAANVLAILGAHRALFLAAREAAARKTGKAAQVSQG